MRLYIAYSSQDTKIAEQVQLALLADHHKVFRDHTALTAGDDFDSRFREAISDTDLMIFLISPSSVRQGSYALTELGYARERWPHPKDHVLPVMVAPVPVPELPAYLQAVTILEPQGNIAAEVAQAVRARQHNGTEDPGKVLPSLRSLLSILVATALVATGFATLFSYAYRRIPIDLSIALLFLVAALCSVLIVRSAWHRWRSP